MAGTWAWQLSKLLTLLAVLPLIAAEDEDTAFSEAVANSEDATGSDDIGSAQTPSSVYVMEHGILGGEWMPRGTMMLSGHGAGYEARLSDAKEFVQLKPQLQQMHLVLWIGEPATNCSLVQKYQNMVPSCSMHFYQICVVLASMWHFRVEWSAFDGIFLVILGVSFFHVFSNVKVSSGLHKQLVKRSIMSSGCTILRVLRGPCRQPFPWSFWQITLRIGMTFWRFQWVMLEFQWPCPTEWSTPWAWCSSIILRFTCQNLHVWRGLVFKLRWEKQMEPSRLQNHHNSSPSCGGNRVQYGICDGCRMNLGQCRCLHVPSQTGSW